jgi:hypothetical protein
VKRLTAVLALGLATTAAARPSPHQRAKADALFRQGKRLMAAQHYAEACDAFEQSFTIDPEIGAELNVAHCYQEWGKLAHALVAYKKAEDMASAAHDDRAPKIHALVVDIDHQVPRFTIKAPPGADASDAHVKLDGAKLAAAQLGEPQLVDPGPHLVEYDGATGKISKVVPIDRGASSELVLDLPAAASATTATSSSSSVRMAVDGTEPAAPGHTQRIAAAVAGGAGIVAMGIAGGLAVSAKSKYSHALTADCMNRANACDPAGLTATHAARHQANIASVVFGAGAAALAAGVVIYLVAPHEPAAAREHALYLVPTLAPGAAGVALGGQL